MITLLSNYIHNKNVIKSVANNETIYTTFSHFKMMIFDFSTCIALW